MRKLLLMAIGILFAFPIVAQTTFTEGELTYQIETKNGESYAIVTACIDDSIENVAVPDSVTNGALTYPVRKIGKEAFYNLKALQSVVVGKNVVEIVDGGWGAFRECSALTTVQLPEGLVTIGNNTFWGCKSLVNINVPSTLKRIGNMAFYNTRMFEFPLPEGLETIGNSAFYSCSALLEARVPSTVTSMGTDVFKTCTSMRTIVFEASMPNIPSGMCTQCTKLSSVTLADHVTRIDDYAFSYCSSLYSFDFSHIESIGNAAFAEGRLQSAVFSDDLTSIGDFSFTRNSNLMSVSLGASVQLGKFAFLGCYRLKDLSLNASNPYYQLLDGVLFSKDMKTLVLYPANRDQTMSKHRYQVPASVTTIGVAAVNGVMLNAMVLPRSLKTIGEAAFFASQIDALTIPETVDSIGPNAFASAMDRYSRFNRLVFLNPVPVYFRNSTTFFYKTASNISLNLIRGRSYHAYVKESSLNDYQTTLTDATFSTELQVTFGAGKTLMSLGYDYDLDFSGQEVTAHVTSLYDEVQDAMLMEETYVGGYVNGKYVPANAGTYILNGVEYDRYNGVILQGDAGTTYTYKIGEGENKKLDNTANYLIGMPADFYVEPTETIDGVDYTTYGLKDGEFKTYQSGGVLSYNKAFMILPSAWQVSAKTSLHFVDNMTSGIDKQDINKNVKEEDGPYYNLQGIQVAKPVKKGIYIRNGKKVIYN